MKLTKGMLDAMLTALSELLGGEGPQGFDEKDGEKVMDEAQKAHSWIHQEIEKRRLKSKKVKNGIS